MKYRDPTIRACTSVNAPVIRRAPAPVKPEPRVHRGAGVRPAPELRELPKLDRFDRLPGGLPPEPYRTPWRRVGLTGRGAREPFNSRAVKGEFWATKAYLEA